MARLSNNSWGAIGIGAATLVYLVEARKLPFGSIRHPDLGFMPILAGLTLLGLCLLMLGREIFWPVQGGREVDRFEEKEGEEVEGFRKPLILSLALFLYPLGFSSLGFLVSTVLLTTISLRVLEYRGWWGSLSLGVLISWGSYFLFAYLLEVQLPRGIFF